MAMKHIVLIGMMGCGKTTVGRLLAARLGRELADTDLLIEAREGRPISELFALKGEAWFRARERDLAAELARRQGLVIACGGGLPLRPDSMGCLRENGIVFWLKRDPGVTYDALDLTGRPLAQDGRAAFVARYEQRAPLYRANADHIIANTGRPEQAVKAIADILEREEEAI